MSCATCLGRKAVALDLFPARRPLFVRCRACRDRRAARRHVVARVAAVVFGAVFSVALVTWLGCR